MKQKIHSEKVLDMESQPRFSIIMPFNIEMRKPKFFLKSLTSAGEKAERDILLKYTKCQAKKLIQNLRDALKKVEGIPVEKTLAIFVSQTSKKVYYFTPTKTDYMPFCFLKAGN